MAINFKKVKAKFQKLKQDLPLQIQNEGQRYFVKSFDQQQWDGKPWEPRKDKKNKRKLLVRRGALRRAVAGSKKEATFSKIRFEVFVQSKNGYNYAEIHNEGGVIEKQARKGTINFRVYKNGRSRFSKAAKANFQQDAVFKEHTIKIPRRRFLGHSKNLDAILRRKINKAVDNCFK
jgi:hypothetical protein